MPLVRIDLVVMCVENERLQVLLGRRKEAPHKSQWGLPGGVLRIDLDSSLEAAAQRIAGERLGLELSNLTQVVSVGGADRDPRAPWAMTVVYRSLVQSFLPALPGKRIEALEWRPADEARAAADLAFDHADLIGQAVDAVRREVRAMRFPPGWIEQPFTIADLLDRTQSVLGSRVDKVTFRRRLDAGEVLEALAGQVRTSGAHRPAQLYRLKTS